MLSRTQAALWVTKTTGHPVRESTLRTWAEVGLLPDEAIRGIAPEYGPCELFAAAVVASLRKAHLRVADFRDGMRQVYRLTRGVGVLAGSQSDWRLLMAPTQAIVLRDGENAPTIAEGPTLIIEAGALAQKARCAVERVPQYH